jgi:Domain of unknown function (DUF5710)
MKTIVPQEYVNAVTRFASKIMQPMRINLVTPFADKDKAKALGARWDATRKVWYVVDVADLSPFMRWIPDMDTALEDVAASSSTRPIKPTLQGTSAAKDASPGVTTRSDRQVPGCTCAVLPWDDCAHTVDRK